MNTHQALQLFNELTSPETGRLSKVLVDNEKTKSVLFAFAAGDGLAEHMAPFAATIHILQGEAVLTVTDESVDGKVGTWIHMPPKTPHSIQAATPVLMLLTLHK